MQRKKLYIAIGIFLLFIIGGTVFMYINNTKSEPVSPSSSNQINGIDTEGEIESKEKESEVYASLQEQLDGFIHTYYDWHYTRSYGKKLEDYITDSFKNNMPKDEHDFEEGNERTDFWIVLNKLKFYTPLGVDSENVDIIEVMASFEAVYKSSHNPEFKRDYIVLLHVENQEGWKVSKLEDLSFMNE